MSAWKILLLDRFTGGDDEKGTGYIMGESGKRYSSRNDIAWLKKLPQSKRPLDTYPSNRNQLCLCFYRSEFAHGTMDDAVCVDVLFLVPYIAREVSNKNAVYRSSRLLHVENQKLRIPMLFSHSIRERNKLPSALQPLVLAQVSTYYKDKCSILAIG